eukprot:2599145-Prymnesium_polylepis.1
MRPARRTRRSRSAAESNLRVPELHGRAVHRPPLAARVAMGAPGTPIRGAHPVLQWGHGGSDGWLLCGAGRRIVAYAV